MGWDCQAPLIKVKGSCSEVASELLDFFDEVLGFRVGASERKKPRHTVSFTWAVSKSYLQP